MAKLKTYLSELRAPFLTASVLPVILGAAVARYDTGQVNLSLFLLTLAGAAFIHTGSNIINDYFDHLSGNDEVNTEFVRPFGGGSRLIQEGLLTPRAVLTMSLSFFIAAAVAGFLLYIQRGPVIVLFGAIGIFLGAAYTAPRLMLAGRGLGELAICVAFGLIGIGTYYVQTASINTSIVIAALPLAILTAAIIIINEFQDATADGATGKRTLVVRIGRGRSIFLFAPVILSAYLPVVIGAVSGRMPPLTLISLVSLPIALKAIHVVWKTGGEPEGMTPANAMTILCHLVTGLALVTAYLML
jgi:1,4-dihydroxy-2-naphthoate octaprenyltransferase